MEKDKNIKNKNDFGHWHGYQEWYHTGRLELRGNLNNGDYSKGYLEIHEYMFSLSATIFMIK